MKSQRIISTLSLFGSASTLICCALPALMVSIGAGASLAGLVGSFPQLIWFSDHKLLVFGSTGLLLAASGFLQWYSSRKSCPIDPMLRAACESSKGWSRPVYFFSIGIYFLGVFFAFIAPRLDL